MKVCENKQSENVRRLLLFLLVMFASLASIGLYAAELPYYISSDMTPYWDDELSVEVDRHHIAAFRLSNQEAQIVDRNDFSGKIKIVNFFFTSCPGICPTSMKNLQAMQKKLGSSQATVLSISITPGIDTPEKLKHYARSYGIESAHWHLLTGDPEIIDTLVKESFFAVLDRNVSQNAYVHTEKVFLVDGDDHIRGVYNATAPADLSRLVEDVRLLQ